MKTGTQLYDEGVEIYPWSTVVRENLAIVAWILLGTLIAMRFNTIAGWCYAGYALVMTFAVMRKLVCTRCYYYGKRCHVGWGLLAGALFGKGRVEEFGTCPGIRFAPLFYGSLALIPVVLGIVSLIMKFSTATLTLLLVLVPIIIYSSVTARKESCSICKMKSVCPGSAVK